jgi:hypothetical protein
LFTHYCLHARSAAHATCEREREGKERKRRRTEQTSERAMIPLRQKARKTRVRTKRVENRKKHWCGYRRKAEEHTIPQWCSMEIGEGREEKA